MKRKIRFQKKPSKNRLVEYLQSADIVSLTYWKWFLFLVLILDLIILYGILRWRKLALALMVVDIIGVAVVLALIKRRREMGEEMPKSELFDYKNFNMDSVLGAGNEKSFSESLKMRLEGI